MGERGRTSYYGHHFAGAGSLDRLGGLGEGAARVGHVVDEDGDLVLHGADEDHATDLAGAGALLVDQGKGQVEAVGDRGSPG